ncbi:DUF4440 domain-containing protein [Lysobacter koreensis]|uniref:DUF4440 domain-containing protein n=1 Tax=Lysobacter koreensis TaxID=266122 RepID=A0ABW2YRV3_9GAMM
MRRHAAFVVRCFPLALLIAGSALAQTPPAAPAAAKLSADECAVWAREMSFAQSVADHDAAAFAAHLHPDAAFGASRAEPTRGRDAIARRWAGIVEGKAVGLEWYPTRTTIGAGGAVDAAAAAAGGAGDVAWSSGPSLLEDRDPATKQRYSIGGFHSVWLRGGDGVWRVLFDDGIEQKPATDAEVAAFRAARPSACPKA